MESEENSAATSEAAEVKLEDDPQPPPQPRPRGRRRRPAIYNQDEDPETLKEKKKKRAVELKLKNLKCTFNETTEVTGKRQKKAPQRFELVPVDKRKSVVENCQGRGTQLGNINWIAHQLRAASLYTLRLLHRIIYRKQGMFAEKQIRKSVMKFSGFPFEASHPEVKRRREQLEKCNMNALQQLRQVLGLRGGTKNEMVDTIMDFLLRPSQHIVEEYITEVMNAKMQQAKFQQQQQHQQQQVLTPQHSLQDKEMKEMIGPPIQLDPDLDLSPSSWTKPVYFKEGNGVKFKFIRAVCANMQRVSDAFIELLHRLLFLNVDELQLMRRNILEFSGLDCETGTPNFVYRMRILSVLPMEQLKLICQVLCLPTWHRPRQFLTEAIMDFLAVPRISAMKKRVPPLFSEECSFTFDCVKAGKDSLPELKSAESEEIEIVPDIHIPDDCESSSVLDCDTAIENEYIGVKLKNFSNIHYQVISTPALKLTDVHMILYLTTSAQNNIRKNILEFSGFPFDESSPEYQCRRGLMEQLSVEDLKAVATVLCVSQYIVDESKNSLIDAILKFLLKPSALLNSSTIMPTISPVPVPRLPVKKKATSSTCKVSQCSSSVVSDLPSGIVISKVESVAPKPSVNHCTMSVLKEDHKPELKKLQACFSSPDIQIVPLPLHRDTPRRESPCSSIEIVPLPVGKEKRKNSSSLLSRKPHAAKKEEKESCPSTSTPLPVHIKSEPCLSRENSPQASPSPPLERSPARADETLSDVKNSASARVVQYLGSDEDDDQPLSKMIGHPNDDQLRALVVKIMKESKLEDVTMKHVICRVFETYPNYDLGYRKEFIKSIVRQILSQMENPNCSVSTTVINI